MQIVTYILASIVLGMLINYVWFIGRCAYKAYKEVKKEMKG